jgi:hypothetical protein
MENLEYVTKSQLARFSLFPPNITGHSDVNKKIEPCTPVQVKNNWLLQSSALLFPKRTFYGDEQQRLKPLPVKF